ncbi:hypothetical protein D6D02_09861 [Aureobasidium pullulans]|nr:hypothetical protein D6D02_09861 [Aureobasidium pullulans]
MSDRHVDVEPVAVFTSFVALSVFTVAMRVYVRKRLVQAFLIEDWLCVLALILYLAQSGLSLRMARIGQSSALRMSATKNMTNIVIADVVVYLCGSVALKLSLAFFFLRFVIERWQRVVIYAMLTTFIADCLSSIFLVLFWCSDPTKRTVTVSSGQCAGGALYAANILQGSLNALSDWLFAIIPITVVIRSTSLTKREKFHVAGTFAFAIAGSVAAVLRIVSWPDLTNDSSSGYRSAVTYITIEMGAGIIASSAATLRPLFRKEQSGEERNRENHSIKVSASSNLLRCLRRTDKFSKRSEQPVPRVTGGHIYKDWWDLPDFMPEFSMESDSKVRRPSCILPEIEE